MKKTSLILLLFIGLGAILLYLNDASFSPLEEKDFQKLFDKYNGTAAKVCSVDFLGGNLKGELYEAYMNNTPDSFLDTDELAVKKSTPRSSQKWRAWRHA